MHKKELNEVLSFWLSLGPPCSFANFLSFAFQTNKKKKKTHDNMH